MAVHPAAAKGFAASSEAYVTGRPDYPPQIVEWLRGDLALGAGKLALDLGAGTGKFIPALHATGASVIAVEPVGAMRARLTETNPGVDIRAGSAEHIPLASGSVDAVVCAQSFHWFANARALGEIRRVLKPGGSLGLVWNVRDEGVPWVMALAAIADRHAGTTPGYWTQEWRSVFPADGFKPLTERHFPHHHTGSPERVIIDRTLSISYIAALPQAEQDAIAGQIRTVIAATPELAGKPEVTIAYKTAAYCCRKLG